MYVCLTKKRQVQRLVRLNQAGGTDLVGGAAHRANPIPEVHIRCAGLFRQAVTLR